MRFESLDDMSAGVHDIAVALVGETVVDEVTFRMAAAVKSQFADLSVTIEKGKSDEEVLFVSGVTGWEDFNALYDMGVTATEFLVRYDGEEQLRVSMEGASVRFESLDDMSAGLEKLTVIISENERVQTSMAVHREDIQVAILFVVILHEEESFYVNLTGALDMLSYQEWDANVEKACVRLDGQEFITATMAAQMHSVVDSMNDVHMAMAMRGFVAIDSEEYLNLQGLHADIIADRCASEISVASRMYGIFTGDEVFNGTTSIDRQTSQCIGDQTSECQCTGEQTSQWVISTNGFELQRLIETSAPTLKPTSAPILRPTLRPTSVPTLLPTNTVTYPSTVEIVFGQVCSKNLTALRILI